MTNLDTLVQIMSIAGGLAALLLAVVQTIKAILEIAAQRRRSRRRPRPAQSRAGK